MVVRLLNLSSILINGSPTSEFEFHCGLKQGDPLAPFLFILVMESLHFSFTRVVEAGIFRGVGISNVITAAAASKIRCSVMNTPFKYLGVMVGGSMSVVKAWDK
ncbi:hypothetical protein Tco_0188490, partial [Tanacetum coccineum]